jgi:hypothetical protein
MTVYYGLSFHHVESLELENCPLADDTEVEILKDFTKLTKLAVLGCGLNNNQLRRITEICPNIEDVYLKNCPRILFQNIGRVIRRPIYGSYTCNFCSHFIFEV